MSRLGSSLHEDLVATTVFADSLPYRTVVEVASDPQVSTLEALARGMNMSEDMGRRAAADAAGYPASVSSEINDGWASIFAVLSRLVCGHDRVMGQPHPDPWRIGADVPGCDQSASRHVIALYCVGRA